MFFEGYGLQAVRKCLRISAALAAEGAAFFSSRVFPQPVKPEVFSIVYGTTKVVP